MLGLCSQHARNELAKLNNGGVTSSLVVSVTRLRGETFRVRGAQTRWKASARPSIAHEDDHVYINGGVDGGIAANRRLSHRLKPSESPNPLHFRLVPSIARKVEPIKQPERLLGLHEPSPATVTYTGDNILPLTSRLRIVEPGDEIPQPKWPVFRVLNEDGMLRSVTDQVSVPVTSKRAPSSLDEARFFLRETNPSQQVEIEASSLLRDSLHPFDDTDSVNTLLRAHRQIIRLREMDTVFNDAQRQGRISFYMTCTGEEAIHIGAGSALENGDHVFAQYREQGVLMWRGFTLDQFANQCFTNDLDLGKGRQMPIHYGSRELNYHTVSSPLGTQLPQAVGAAHRLKMQGKPNVAIAFFGDGCASTTDFHAALNFAATLSSPVIFFCRNNGYAISTPTTEQYHGDGIVGRAPGYGMAAIRVDGNDVFAVNAAVREAKKYALENNAPVLIEGMTYRLGHHSTSDDSTQYRSKEEIDDFSCRMDPLTRFNHFVKRLGYYNDSDIMTIKGEERSAVIQAMKKAEARPKPTRESLFHDVYHDVPPHLEEQRAALEEHLIKYPAKK